VNSASELLTGIAGQWSGRRPGCGRWPGWPAALVQWRQRIRGRRPL